MSELEKQLQANNMSTPQVQNIDGPDAPEPAQAKMKSMGEKLEGQVQRSGAPPAHVVTPSDSARQGPASFWPSRLYTTDPRDKKYQLRAGLVDERGVIPNIGQVQVGEEFMNYMADKEEQMQLADFRQWMLDNVVDLSNPVSQEYWVKMFPELVNDKIELFEKQLDKAKRLAMINLRGPKDPEDFVLIWKIDKGLEKLPNFAPWDPRFVPEEKDMMRGLFNIKRFFPQSSLQTQGGAPSRSFNWKRPLVPGTQTSQTSPLNYPNTAPGISRFYLRGLGAQ